MTHQPTQPSRRPARPAAVARLAARPTARRTAGPAACLTICLTTCLTAAAACHDSTAPGGGTSRAYVRVVNSAFQATDTATSDNPFGCPCTPLAIDVLLDSATTAPSVVGMAPLSVGVGTEGPAPAGLNARYAGIAAGLHSFVARASGPSNPTFFTTSSQTAYLPKQYLPGQIYYTLVLAGVNPVQPDSGPAVLASNSAFVNGSDIPLNIDDPYTPPTVQTAGGPTLQARYRIVNAAPFSAGLTAVYLTPGATPPTPTALASTLFVASVGPRAASAYFNVGAGVYTLTVQNFLAGVVEYQASITFGAGEVRTLVLQNTVPAGASAIPAGGVPAETASDYYKLTNILDNQFK